uniref:Uncharacterized protein n=1 Tax=Anopheles culicifacies TaxID=139723 RepID=A0A182M3L8_9DIPT
MPDLKVTDTFPKSGRVTEAGKRCVRKRLVNDFHPVTRRWREVNGVVDLCQEHEQYGDALDQSIICTNAGTVPHSHMKLLIFNSIQTFNWTQFVVHGGAAFRHLP